MRDVLQCQEIPGDSHGSRGGLYFLVSVFQIVRLCQVRLLEENTKIERKKSSCHINKIKVDLNFALNDGGF